MDSFNVIISPKALSQLNGYIDYLQYTLLNDQAAYNVWQDALETRSQLSKVAGSLKLCAHPHLKKHGYHIIHFMRHHYLMLYRIEGTTAYVDAIYHQLQDYENTFADEIRPIKPKPEIGLSQRSKEQQILFSILWPKDYLALSK